MAAGQEVHTDAAYGFDAPYVPIFLCGWGSLLVVVSAFAFVKADPVVATGVLALGLFTLLSGLSFVYTTRRGKFEIWADLVDELTLDGDERVLDLGCGRGAVLVRAAKRVPRGRAVGIDLWRRVDQTGNTADATRHNLDREGVEGQSRLTTGDMRALPFVDATFDVVVSSLAIHNIPDPQGRHAAVVEAFRVLRPGGRLLVADFRATGEYAETLRNLGALDVASRNLGWRFWYGGPWAATRLITATKA
jgi:SAM-dependent methyltransferase